MCKDMLERLLVPEGKMRITAAQAMRHTWTDMSDKVLAYNDTILAAPIRTKQNEANINRVFCKALGRPNHAVPFPDGYQ